MGVLHEACRGRVYGGLGSYMRHIGVYRCLGL